MTNNELVSHNPTFSGDDDLEINVAADEAMKGMPTDLPLSEEAAGEGTSEAPSSRGRLKKIATGIAFVCAVSAAFAGGYLAAPRDSGVESGSNQLNGDASIERSATLEEIYREHPQLGQITPAVLGEIIAAYEADPNNWDDSLVPKEFVALLSEAKEEELGDRRLLSAGAFEERKSMYARELDRDFDFPLAQNAWNTVDNENYVGAVRSGDDKIAVRRSGSTCVLVSEESNSLEDWINNLDLGDEDVRSIQKYNVRDESCGCDKKTWWWCSRYKSCPVYTKLGEGFDGFIKPWNAMRLAVWSQMQSTCAGVSSYHFYGFSRGGAIIAAAAAALKKEGLIDASDIQVITFGAPRVLDKGFSDDVHNDFDTLRLVNRKDPVPSIPYGWMGYRHYGTMACRECGYPEERDRPNFSWIVDGVLDHTKYGDWF